MRIERCRIEDSGTRLDDRQGYAIFRQRRHGGGSPLLSRWSATRSLATVAAWWPASRMRTSATTTNPRRDGQPAGILNGLGLLLPWLELTTQRCSA